MGPTIVVGLIFLAIIAFAGIRSYKSMKQNKCPGCSGGCACSGSCPSAETARKAR